MSIIKKVLEDQEKEYKEKFDLYEQMYFLARQLDETEIQDMCMKKLVGLKQLIDYMPTFSKRIVLSKNTTEHEN